MANEIPIDLVMRVQDEMSALIDRATKSVDRLDKEFDGVDDSSDKAARSFDHVGKEAAQAAQQTGGFSVKLAALGNIAGDLAMRALSAVGSAVGDVVGEMIRGNAEMERYETQFGVLLGSTDKAKQRLKELAEFGAKTPFELPEVVRADKILQGFGLHSEESAKKFGLSGEQIRTLAGDMAAGTGQSFEDIAGYLGKFASGSTGEAISRFQELGITTREELAKMGLEFSKSGELTTPTAQAFTVLAKVAQDKFGGMMDAQSKTFEGMVSNLNDWKSQTIRTIGEPIFEVLSEKLGGLLGLLSSPMMTEWITNFANSIANSLGSIIDWFDKTFGKAFDLFVSMDEWSSGTAEGIGGVIDEILGLNSVFQKTGELLDLSDEWSSGFLETVGGLIDSLLGLEQVFQLVGWAIDNTVKDIFTNTTEDFDDMYEMIDGVMTDIGDVINTVLSTIAKLWNEYGDDIMQFVRETWTSISDIINTVVAIVVRVIEINMPLIKRIVNDAMDTLRIAFAVAWAAIQLTVGTVIDAVKGIVTATLQILNGDAQGALDTLKGMFSRIWTRIYEVVTKLIGDVKAIIDERLKQTGTSVDEYMTGIWNAISNAWTSAYNTVNYWVGTIKNLTAATFQEMRDDVTLSFNTMKDNIISALRTALNFYNSIAPFLGYPVIPTNGMFGGRPSGSANGGRGEPASRNTTFNLTANYGNQDERSLRDDVQMLQMLYGGV